MSKLYLNRKLNETLWVGDDVRITVDEITNGRVNLCIEAPASISIDRHERRLNRQLVAALSEQAAGKPSKYTVA